MKALKLLLVILLLLDVAALAQTIGFTNTVNTSLPDANPNGLSSTITVAGVQGSTFDVSLYLNIAGGWNGDVYAYLSHDGGGFAILLNRVGKSGADPTGYGDTGFDVVLEDGGATDIHAYGGNSGVPVTGTWQPDGRNVDPQLVVSSDARTANFASFKNTDPNGVWTLFVADMAAGYNSTLIQWGLNLQTIPEPGPAAVALFAGALYFVRCRRAAGKRAR